MATALDLLDDLAALQAQSTTAATAPTTPEVSTPPKDPRAAPKPGLYPHTPGEVFHQWDAVSHHHLSHLNRTPAHLRAYLENDLDTAALRLGRAVQNAVLNPNLFRDLYVLAERCSKTTTKASQCSRDGAVRRDGKWYCTQHYDEADGPADAVLALTSDVWDQTLRMRDRVLGHPEVQEMLAASLYLETALTWDHADTGLRCKIRPDIYLPGVFADLTTSKNASASEFARSLFDYRYHHKAVFNMMGLEAHGLAVTEARFIVVENIYPFEPVIYRLGNRSLDKAHEEVPRLLARYRECLESGVWPGYDSGVHDLDLPHWAFAA